MSATIADLQSDNDALIKKLDQQDERIEELERRNALLRAAVKAADKTSEVYHGRNATIEAIHVEFARLDGHLQKAIDGGALDGVDK